MNKEVIELYGLARQFGSGRLHRWLLPRKYITLRGARRLFKAAYHYFLWSFYGLKGIGCCPNSVSRCALVRSKPVVRNIAYRETRGARCFAIGGRPGRGHRG